LTWLVNRPRALELIESHGTVFAVALDRTGVEEIALETSSGWQEIGAVALDGFQRLVDDDNAEGIGKLSRSKLRPSAPLDTTCNCG
jgi:hypothetical protein